MSTIIKKIEELFHFKLPDRSALAAMTEAEQRALKARFMAAIPDEETVAQMYPEERRAVIDQVMQVAASMPGPMLEEAMPAGDQSVLVAQGRFKDGETYNKGEGRALIVRFSDGRRILRFEDFTVSNGPALHVLLASNPAPTNKDDLGTTLDLGALKSNQGDQNYEIPPGTTLEQFQSIVIFCTMFNVVISTATLQAA